MDDDEQPTVDLKAMADGLRDEFTITRHLLHGLAESGADEAAGHIAVAIMRIEAELRGL